MKKFLLTLIILVSGLMIANAQNDTVLYIENYHDGNQVLICLEKYQEVLIYPQSGCDGFVWEFNGDWHWDNPLIVQATFETSRTVIYHGCDLECAIEISFMEKRIPNPFTHTIWKRRMGMDSLAAVGHDSIDWPFNCYSFLWSTGETERVINVTEPGTYTCEISDPCGSTTRTFIVRDNVEIYRAGVDLRTGLNRPTWRTTPEQAEYISEVKVERDGFVVGTVPYTQGYFLDNIGSENAARNYRLTGILSDGTECPIPSYQKGTPHVDYSPNASNPNKLNMAWTPPFIEEGAPVSIAYFQICKYDPNTEEVTVIDQIGANNTIGSYDVSLFDGGYATLGVLFDESRDNEDVSFSNLSEDILAVGEIQNTYFNIYPNPANSFITVEGFSIITITNIVGQTMMTREINGKETISLPQGVWFVEMNGEKRKVVVE